jgi:hypothetical protein
MNIRFRPVPAVYTSYQSEVCGEDPRVFATDSFNTLEELISEVTRMNK